MADNYKDHRLLGTIGLDVEPITARATETGGVFVPHVNLDNITPSNPLPVEIRETHHIPVNELFHLHTGTSSTLTVEAAIGDTAVTVVNGALFSVGDSLQISNGAVETTFSIITAIATNVLTLDRPHDLVHDIGATVEVVHTDLSTTAAGTLAAPISHVVMPEPGVIWHLERIILSMTHTAAADDSSFGGIAALTNGVLIRAYVNGQYGTFTNWKSNLDIRLDMFDVDYTAKAGAGLNGTHGRGSFNRIGVTVKLDGTAGDYLEALVQDDLTGLSSFQINGQGHHENA